MTTFTQQFSLIQSDHLARLLRIKEIYCEPTVFHYPHVQSILANYLKAKLSEALSHWNLPKLHGGEGLVAAWNRIKLTTFINLGQISPDIHRYAVRQGMRTEPNPIDLQYWVYEIAENGDCFIDVVIYGRVKKLIMLFCKIYNVKVSFGMKRVNRDVLTDNPQHKDTSDLF